ncbi:MAG TPA: response regulator transcription factor [Anaerolineales bacterium]
MTGEAVLVVDDEPAILKLARMYLEREGYKVHEAQDGELALELVAKLRPAVMVLDVMLPKVDGLEVCRRLRAQGDDTAILMLTARSEDVDKILGLELGADDYLTKPFNPRELVARVKAIQRRVGRQPEAVEKTIRVADLMIDMARREVRSGADTLELRPKEFDLLVVMAEQPGRVFTREQLLQKAWGFDFYGQTRTIDVHVAQLRRKLQNGAARIETITGVGYKLTS